MDSGDQWSEKIPLLYNLRSGLVHGDISRKEEWEKYRDYRITYNSDPFDDIEHMVLSALRNYFNIVTTKRGQSTSLGEAKNGQKDKAT